MAEDHGRFDCTGSVWSCQLGRPTIDPDTVNFIRSVANLDISQWRRGDTITVCYGSECAVYVLSSVGSGLNGLAFVSAYPNPDTMMGGVEGGTCGGGGSLAVLIPNYETWHFTSNIPGDPGYYVTFINGYTRQNIRHSTQVC